MIIARITAGLCNQMYFFSTAYALSREWKEELVLDINIDGFWEWIYLLDEFNVSSYRKIIYPVRYNVSESYHKMPIELQKKVAIIDETYFEQEGEYLTIPQEKFQADFPNKDIYLKGTFLSRQMFTKYLDDLRRIFTLREPSEFVSEFVKSIDNVTAIGVHVRRQGFTVLGDDNGMIFFKAAIVHMRQLYINAKFYIFSDELDYVKKNLGTADDIFYVDAMNGFRGDVEEFVCLTKCHHYILTRRSTYGRMAEILNDHADKVSVLYGENTWNDSEDRFHFLSDEDVERLSKLFEYHEMNFDFDINVLQGKSDDELKKLFIRIGLDSGKISGDNRKEIIYKKAQFYVKVGKLTQAMHLCNLLEEQSGEDGKKFHEFYSELLYNCGRKREALVEYIGVAKQSELFKDILRKREYEVYKSLLHSSSKHYIIVQYGKYSSQYLSEMQMIGLILGRMGNEISFVFKKDMPEDLEENQDNLVMRNWENNIDNKWLDLILNNGFSIGRFFYGYPCYDYSNMIGNTNEYMRRIIEKYPDKEAIIIGREPEVMTTDPSIKKVFIDFSEPFDEAYLKDRVGQSNISNMYECADVIVTSEQIKGKNDQEVIQIEEALLMKPLYCVNKEVCYDNLTMYTDDYLDIALKIASTINSC